MCISLDWNNVLSAGIGAFVGAITAFAAMCIRERCQNKQIEKELLIRYFYDLHMLLRNMSYFHNGIQKVRMDPVYVGKESGLYEMIDLNFNTEKLAFVCDKEAKLYEQIQQLSLDIHCFALQCHDHNIQTITVGLLYQYTKILGTIKSVNNLLNAHYNQKNLIKGHVLANLEETEKYIQKQLSIFLEEKNPEIDKVLEKLEEIKQTWNISM